MDLQDKIPPRLAQRITVTQSGCWEVGGFRDKDGYTFYHIRLTGPGAKQRTHRYTYEVYKGKIPDGLVIDHLCKNKCCCNPEHLEAVTQAENNRRAGIFDLGKWSRSLSPEAKSKRAALKTEDNKRRAQTRTHCRKGHAYLPNNFYVPLSGTRRCQICFYNSPSIIARQRKEDTHVER